MEQKIDLTERIINHLLIHSPFIKDIGLYHGKMGIAIAFYHYALYSQDIIYSKYADELVEQIYNSINSNSPINMENGLCGIAWGICHLIQHNFVEGEINEILDEIDNKIMERSLLYIKDITLPTGLEGIYIYVLERKKLAKMQKSQIPFDSTYLHTLDKVISINSINCTDSIINRFVVPIINNESNLQNFSLGLNKGCAGYIYKSISI
ncbi:lanthionine synthetase LanC family protein [uncultured Bacteroides sp.]|jgi:hypothetical protein|uniref:lanthionine synthetase LanC family protein n=1 Tax=uncultured Bacteroides sp. TaxID=162156 RepID=UPI0025835D19|nr:lanthionine synthetase LanC family protein [uncultured Bacteroides sp.]